MTRITTHYDNLKVARDAPDIVIRAAYKSLVQKYHPDKNPGDADAGRIMAIINRSYEVLSDPGQRRSHDFWIEHEELKLRQRESVRPSESASANQPPPPQPSSSPQPQPSPATRWVAAFVLAAIVGGVAWKDYQQEQELQQQQQRQQSERFAAVGPVPESEKASFMKSATPTPDPASYSRPATAPNGMAWPGHAGYVKGYPVRNTRGYSEIEVDNTQGGTDVFAKLVSIDAGERSVVRQIYLPAGSRFTMKTVAPGKYDLRYRDLDTGGLSRSESFDVEEKRIGNRQRFSNLTMTLYKVADGNFHTYGLSEDEF